MTRNVEHTCDIDDKYCQEGADPNRHPDHDTHIGGCICSLGDTYNKIEETQRAEREATTARLNQLGGG